MTIPIYNPPNALVLIINNQIELINEIQEICVNNNLLADIKVELIKNLIESKRKPKKV